MQEENYKKNKFWAVVWILTWSFSYVTSTSTSKALSVDISSTMLLFMRVLFGFCFFLPFMIKNRKEAFKTKRIYLHMFRVVLGICAIFFTYQSYRNLPLCTAISIGFVGPAITTMLSVFILKEKIRLIHWVLIVAGYTGVLFIAQPQNIKFDPFIISMLIACFFAGSSIICTRIMSSTESRITIMSYSNLFSLFVALLIVPFFWQTPSLNDTLFMIVVGAFGAFSQYCYISAISYESPSFVSPFEYIRLVIAVPVGYFIFQETPDQNMIIGAIIIIVSTYLLTSIPRK